MTRLRTAAVDVAAVLGAVCVLAVIAAAVVDVRPLVFRSGSMAPTIGTGALALVHRVDAGDLRVGDVVTVMTASGSRVTHRIKDLSREGDRTTLLLRGDANAIDDPHPYHVTEAQRVVVAVPVLGYAVGWLTEPLGRLALGCYAAFLLMALVRPAPRPRRTERPRGRPHATRLRRRSRAMTVVVTIMLLGLLHVSRPTPGWAAWGDSVAVAGTRLSGHVVQAPDRVTCSGGGVLASLTYTWPGKDPRYTYQVDLVSSSGSVHRTRLVQEAGAPSYSITYAPADLPGGSFTVRVRSRLTQTPAWTSASTRNGAGSSNILGATTACGA